MVGDRLHHDRANNEVREVSGIMASGVQPIPCISLASDTQLAPRDRAAIGASQTATDPVVDGRGSQQPSITNETTTLGFRSDSVELKACVAEALIRAKERPTGNRSLRARLLALDLAAVGLCWIWIGFVLLHASSILGRLGPGVAAAAITLVAMRVTGLYRSRLCVRKADELWRILIATLWGAAGFVVAQSGVSFHGPQALICAGSFFATASALRWQFGRWLREQRAQGRYLRSVVLIGSNDDAAQLRTMLRSEPELGYKVVGMIGNSQDSHLWDGLPVSHDLADIPRIAASTGANGIVIVPYAVTSVATQRAVDIASSWHLHVQVWPGFRGIGSGRLRKVPVSGEAFFYIEPRLSSRWQIALKRTIDVIGAATVLALSAPIVAAAALLIKIEDRGPVLHHSERIGMHGKSFYIYKLRSMAPEGCPASSALAALNERTDGPLFKASHDPRVTKVGRFLRASSIDELPQLWNVLKGTMSLVGPRPALPSEAAQFDEELQRRHSVRPGLTGLWQIEARHNPSFNAYRRLDMRYVDNWTLYLDISILLSTVPAVVSQTVHALLNSRRS